MSGRSDGHPLGDPGLVRCRHCGIPTIPRPSRANPGEGAPVCTECAVEGDLRPERVKLRDHVLMLRSLVSRLPLTGVEGGERLQAWFDESKRVMERTEPTEADEQWESECPWCGEAATHHGQLPQTAHCSRCRVNYPTER